MYHENGANKKWSKCHRNMCWYNKAFDEIAKCNEDPNVDSTEMFNGNCPTKIYQTEGWQTSGGVKGDFLVLEGKKSAKYTESLSESALVIYGFENDDGETGIMIEGYKLSGLYGYASTWEDWKSFKKNLFSFFNAIFLMFFILSKSQRTIYSLSFNFYASLLTLNCCF